MSGTVADKKRLLRVTAGNLRNSHLYVNGHYDFFPEDCIGPPKKSTKRNGQTIEILLDGLNRTVATNIGTEANSGKPRRFFRGRRWVKDFYEHHGIKTGDVLALERVAKRRYRLYPFEAKRRRELDWHQFLDEPPSGRGATVLELFTGCGGLAWDSVRALGEREVDHVGARSSASVKSRFSSRSASTICFVTRPL